MTKTTEMYGAIVQVTEWAMTVEQFTVPEMIATHGMQPSQAALLAKELVLCGITYLHTPARSGPYPAVYKRLKMVVPLARPPAPVLDRPLLTICPPGPGPDMPDTLVNVPEHPCAIALTEMGQGGTLPCARCGFGTCKRVKLGPVKSTAPGTGVPPGTSTI